MRNEGSRYGFGVGTKDKRPCCGGSRRSEEWMEGRRSKRPVVINYIVVSMEALRAVWERREEDEGLRIVEVKESMRRKGRRLYTPENARARCGVEVKGMLLDCANRKQYCMSIDW